MIGFPVMNQNKQIYHILKPLGTILKIKIEIKYINMEIYTIKKYIFIKIFTIKNYITQ